MALLPSKGFTGKRRLWSWGMALFVVLKEKVRAKTNPEFI